MSIVRALLLASLLACTPLLSLAGVPYVEVSLAADGTPLVHYELEAGTRLRFSGDERWQETVRKKGWKFDSACFALESNELALGTDARCATETIRLEWDEAVRDRMYPAVVRLRNGGALIYAAYLQVLSPDRKEVAEIRLDAPKGGVAGFRDRKSASRLVLDSRTFERSGSAWFYLGPDRFEEVSGLRVLVDDGVPPALRSIMTRLAPRLLDLYADRLQVAYAKRPTLYLTWVGREQPARTFQADVVPGGDIRFGVVGASWADARGEGLESFTFTVAHEIAHFWNSEIHDHPEWAASWIAEGNSELLGNAALLALGEASATDVARHLDAATLECTLAAGRRAWKDVWERQNGRFPYTCGFALQFAIAAAARRDDRQRDAFEYWRELWNAHPSAYEAVFEQDARAHGDEALANLLRDTLAGPLPLVDGLRALRELAGLHTDRVQALSPAMVPAVARQLMWNVMSADCHGSVSFFGRPDHFHVDYQSNLPCDQLRPGTDVARVAGVPLTEAPLEAADAMERACSAAKTVTLGTLDGRTLHVACPAGDAPGIRPALIHFRPDEVASILDHKAAH